MLKLTRELRFGLHPHDPPLLSNSSNGFAANPPLTGIAPFLVLTATLSGEPDPITGMLINIKTVDQILRDIAVPYLRTAHYNEKTSTPSILIALFPILKNQFSPHTFESLAIHLSPFLHFSIHKKDPLMLQLTQRFEFSAAHRLHSKILSEKENWDIFGRCTNPNGHGHNYELEVTLAGTPDPSTGELLPIPRLQQIVNETIINHFDHKHLNLDLPEFHSTTGLNPTVENIAKVIYQKLKPAIAQSSPATLAHIKVWETPKTVAEYSE